MFLYLIPDCNTYIYIYNLLNNHLKTGIYYILMNQAKLAGGRRIRQNRRRSQNNC